jgi:hypothetical protein
VKLTFFVVDVSEFATIRAVRDEFLDAERRPASTLSPRGRADRARAPDRDRSGRLPAGGA